MAEPIEFEQQNAIFTKPEDMTDDECVSLHVFQSETQIISCWQLTEDEMIEVAKTGKIYLSVMGQAQPPVCVLGESPFIDEVEKDGD